MSGEAFEWECREDGCKAVHRIYRDHIEHLVEVHGLLGGRLWVQKKAEQEDGCFCSAGADERDELDIKYT